MKDYEERRNNIMLERTLKRVKLPSAGWEALREDIKSEEPKEFLVRKYGIKSSDLKRLKEYLNAL